MGLIHEIQGVQYIMNRQERAKRDRERQKILLENYNNEIATDLRAEFSTRYNNNTTKKAYNEIIMKKDEIIEKIFNIISKITYTDDSNGRKYYTYSNFDIVGDIEKKFYQVLKAVNFEFLQVENARIDELCEKLGDRLTYYYYKFDDKINLIETLESYKIRTDVVESVTHNKNYTTLLLQKYDKVLNEIKKEHKTEIQRDKRKRQQWQQLQRQKIACKRQNSIITQLVIGDILGDISKLLNKKRREKIIPVF